MTLLPTVLLAISCQLYIVETSSCIFHGFNSPFSTRPTASLTASARAIPLGSVRLTRCGGKTSGTPPTLVLTTKRPLLAASRMAIQNASVREALRKICPCCRVSQTRSFGIDPVERIESRSEFYTEKRHTVV